MYTLFSVGNEREKLLIAQVDRLQNIASLVSSGEGDEGEATADIDANNSLVVSLQQQLETQAKELKGFILVLLSLNYLHSFSLYEYE